MPLIPEVTLLKFLILLSPFPLPKFLSFLFQPREPSVFSLPALSFSFLQLYTWSRKGSLKGRGGGLPVLVSLIRESQPACNRIFPGDAVLLKKPAMQTLGLSTAPLISQGVSERCSPSVNGHWKSPVGPVKMQMLIQ